MTQYPGPYGQPGPPPNGRAGKLKPRLRSVKVQIEDVTGTSWVTTSALVTDPKPRSAAGKAVGYVFTLLLLAGAAFLSAWFLTWTISVIHEWWTFVPEMPYSVALKLTGISFLGGVIAKFIGEFAKYAMGTRRVPETSDND